MWIDSNLSQLKHPSYINNTEIFDELEKSIPFLKINRDPLKTTCSLYWYQWNDIYSNGGKITIIWNPIITKIKVKLQIDEPNMDPYDVVLDQKNLSISFWDITTKILEINVEVADINFYQWKGKTQLNNILNFQLTPSVSLTPSTSPLEFKHQISDIWENFSSMWQLMNTKIGMIKYPSFQVNNQTMNFLCDGTTPIQQQNEGDFIVSGGQNYGGLIENSANLKQFGLRDYHKPIVIYDSINTLVSPFTKYGDIEFNIAPNEISIGWWEAGSHKYGTWRFSQQPLITIYKRTCEQKDFSINKSNISDWLYDKFDPETNGVLQYNLWFSPYLWSSDFPVVQRYLNNVSAEYIITPSLYKSELPYGNYTLDLDDDSKNSLFGWTKIKTAENGWEWITKKVQKTLVFPYQVGNENRSDDDPDRVSVLPIIGDTLHEWFNANGFRMRLNGNTPYSTEGYISGGTAAYQRQFFSGVTYPFAKPYIIENSSSNLRSISLTFNWTIPIYMDTYARIDSLNNTNINNLITKFSGSSIVRTGVDEMQSLKLQCTWSFDSYLRGSLPPIINFIQKPGYEEELDPKSLWWTSRNRRDSKKDKYTVNTYQKIGLQHKTNESGYLIMITFENRIPEAFPLLLEASDITIVSSNAAQKQTADIWQYSGTIEVYNRNGVSISCSIWGTTVEIEPNNKKEIYITTTARNGDYQNPNTRMDGTITFSADNYRSSSVETTVWRK